jgi:uncharacterized membrane-anchored protein
LHGQDFEMANNSIKKAGKSQEEVAVIFKDILRLIVANL